jgi:hypothetical protein
VNEGKNMTMLVVGDVFRLDRGMQVYAMIPAKFVYSNAEDDTPARDVVVIGPPRASAMCAGQFFETDDMAGEYVVVDACMTGGSIGHGSLSPHGWRVVAHKLRQDATYDPQGREVSFYQSGAFSVVYPDIPVLRTMRRSVTFE